MSVASVSEGLEKLLHDKFAGSRACSKLAGGFQRGHA
jgi:hypothetical protein